MAKASNDELFRFWQSTLQHQRHFNEMVLKTRTFGFAIILGLYTASLYFYEKVPNALLNLVVFQTHVGSLIVLYTFLLLYGLYSLDRHYYFEMLIESVKKAEIIEEKLKKIDKDFSLTTDISKRISENFAVSHLKFFYWITFGVGAVLIAIFSKKFESGGVN